MPPHSHDLIAAGEPGNSIDPNNNFLSQTDSRYDVDIYTDPNKIDTTMNPISVESAGSASTTTIEIRSAYTCVNYVIWYDGSFPPRPD